MTRDHDQPYAEVIGDPISQSKSPLIHGFWLKQLGIAARYGARKVNADTLRDYLAQRRKDPRWKGCNVTMPLKQHIIPLLDSIDPGAKRIGAVNTVVPDAQRGLVGFNTDADGFCEPLSNQLETQHLFRMARIVGSGGAARAIVHALSERGFTLVIAARDQTKARALLDALAPNGEHYTAPLGHFGKPTDFAFDDREQCLDLVINASPLGMRGQPELAFDLSHAPPGSIVYDIVTDPIETTLIKHARSHGFATIDGLAMLIGQAAIAFEKLFGSAAPRDRDPDLREMLLK